MLGLNPKGAAKLTVSCDNAGASSIRAWHRREMEDHRKITCVLLLRLKTTGGIGKKAFRV